MTSIKQKVTSLNVSIDVAISRLEGCIRIGETLRRQIFDNIQDLDRFYFLQKNGFESLGEVKPEFINNKDQILKEEADRIEFKANAIKAEETKNKSAKNHYSQWYQSVQNALTEIYVDNRYNNMFEKCMPKRWGSYSEIDDTNPDNVHSILQDLKDILKYKVYWINRRKAYLEQFQNSESLIRIEAEILFTIENIIKLMPKSVYSFDSMGAGFHEKLLDKTIELSGTNQITDNHFQQAKKELANNPPVIEFNIINENAEFLKRDFKDVINKARRLLLSFQSKIIEIFGITFNDLPNVDFDPVPQMKHEYHEPSDSIENKEKLGEYTVDLIEWIMRLPVHIDIYLKQQATVKNVIGNKGTVEKQSIPRNAKKKKSSNQKSDLNTHPEKPKTKDDYRKIDLEYTRMKKKLYDENQHKMPNNKQIYTVVAERWGISFSTIDRARRFMKNKSN